MATIVQKYGGSSVADAQRLRHVASAVVDRKRAGDRVVVVVSAMGDTTDDLIAQARAVSSEPPQRELDMLVTAGERISMALLSMAIQQLGEEAISFTGSQSGIITEPSHQGARVLEVKPIRIVEELDRDRIVIVAGYQGVSTVKEVTTLGRGGSDTTAVALAAALDADACEIYSDVDGVYTADPRICPQARLLRELDYVTMQTMAGVGAKVLNAQAVEFARRAGITLLARKTGDISGRQTEVRADVGPQAGVVAVVGAKAVTRLTGEVSDLATLLAQLNDIGGRPLAMIRNAILDLLIDRTDIAGLDHGPLARLATKVGLKAEPVALATIVGNSLLSAEGLWPRVEASLGATGVTSVAWFCAPTHASAVVAPDRCDEAVRALHELV